ncbi:MAG: LysM peptidoglycan-binding domain-containing protein [Actinobacteria bacterium]|nr:LysM peptidoglycan-binding domain-containing protein [Actinomycetota bacterium]
MNGDPAESGPRAWGPRLLAPLAFFTAATILVLIIHNSVTSESEGSTTPTTTSPTTTASEAGATGPTTTLGTRQKRFYRIREGDTLEAIALRFDTTVDDLLVLNPAIEPNSLTPGRRIRVR